MAKNRLTHNEFYVLTTWIKVTCADVPPPTAKRLLTAAAKVLGFKLTVGNIVNAAKAAEITLAKERVTYATASTKYAAAIDEANKEIAILKHNIQILAGYLANRYTGLGDGVPVELQELTRSNFEIQLQLQ